MAHFTVTSVTVKKNSVPQSVCSPEQTYPQIMLSIVKEQPDFTVCMGEKYSLETDHILVLQLTQQLKVKHTHMYVYIHKACAHVNYYNLLVLMIMYMYLCQHT